VVRHRVDGSRIAVAQPGVLQVVFGFLAAGQGESPGHRRRPEPGQLREHVPDPMPLFPPGAQFTDRRFEILRLRVHESLYAVHPRTLLLPTVPPVGKRRARRCGHIDDVRVT
jgi:hypothetical protein